jgi:hypothetical protein
MCSFSDGDGLAGCFCSSDTSSAATSLLLSQPVTAVAVLNGGNSMPKRGDDELSFTIPAEATTTSETRSKDSSSDRTASCAIAEQWTDGLVLHGTAGDGRRGRW